MADPKRPTVVKQPSPPPTVLVVDDEEVVRDVLTRALKKRNLGCDVAETGAEAIEKLKSRSYGCVLSDKNLPDMSGVDVLKEALRLQPFCARIMITGYTTPESILEVLRMGASDYIEKPFNDMQLVLQRIVSSIEHQRTEFERNTLADVLKGMQAQLRKQSDEMFQKGTELELFESVLELRVDEATAALREQLASMEQQRRNDREVDRSVLQRLDELLISVGGHLQVAEESDDGSLPVLRDLETRLKEATALLREGLGAQ